MKQITLVFLLIPVFVFSQIQFKTVSSKTLQEKRQIKIQLPRGYEKNTEKSYPVIFVLDGDYLFEPVAGNVDYYSYWNEMPEAIVVGINQNGFRNKDVMFGSLSYLPKNKSADFFEFLGGELLPLIDKNYRTLNFDIIVGLDLTANFINYYLFKKDPLFRGYINLSPDYAPKMHERILNALKEVKEKTWYYLATGTKDINKLRTDIIGFDSQLKTIDNDNVFYSFDNFENASHYALVGNAIPRALEAFFEIYRPIGEDKIDKLVKEEKSPFAYLQEKYETIREAYGLDMKVSVQDFMQISRAIEKTEQWDEYKSLGKLADKAYPKKMIGFYFQGRYYEEKGNTRKAIRLYQKAYGLESVPGLSNNEVLDKIGDLQTKSEE